MIYFVDGQKWILKVRPGELGKSLTALSKIRNNVRSTRQAFGRKEASEHEKTFDKAVKEVTTRVRECQLLGIIVKHQKDEDKLKSEVKHLMLY